jgi:hypothetical protein
LKRERMRPRSGGIVGGFVLIAAVAAADEVQAAASCRDYPALAARALKPRLDALRLIEREAADRLTGLDTRTFAWLAGQARMIAAVIDEPRALADEDTLARCPDPVPHLRRVCGIAASALAMAMDEQEVGAASAVAKQAFGEAMAICEGLSGIAPLHSAFRRAD